MSIATVDQEVVEVVGAEVEGLEGIPAAAIEEVERVAEILRPALQERRRLPALSPGQLPLMGRAVSAAVFWDFIKAEVRRCMGKTTYAELLADSYGAAARPLEALGPGWYRLEVVTASALAAVRADHPGVYKAIGWQTRAYTLEHDIRIVVTFRPAGAEDRAEVEAYRQPRPLGEKAPEEAAVEVNRRPAAPANGFYDLAY